MVIAGRYPDLRPKAALIAAKGGSLGLTRSTERQLKYRALVCCLMLAVGSLAQQVRGDIIDIHCHVAGIGAGGSGCFFSPALKDSYKFNTYVKAFGVTMSELERQGDSLIVKRLSEKLARSRHVDKAVVLAMDGVIGADGQLDRNTTQFYVPNDFVYGEVRKYTNLLYGASINPYRKDALKRLEREAHRGARLIKWLPNIQMIDPMNPVLEPFYRKLAQLNMPLLCHTGDEDAFKFSRDEYGDPWKLRQALELGVTVIAAHGASLGKTDGMSNMERLLVLCGQYEDLYIDISAMTQINRWGHLRRLLRDARCRERLVYGTDMPLNETLMVSPLYSVLTIGPWGVWSLWRERNVWDRDVSYKRKLGVPAAVFARAAEIIARTGS